MKPYGFKTIFKDCRIVGLAGRKNTGKTNNLIYLIKEFRLKNPDVPVYVYGFKPEVMPYLSKLGVLEISEIEHLINKRDCVLVCDEFQKLHLNDRRYTDLRDDFKNAVYHNNVYVLLSSPDIREFNSVIGGIIERWLIKNVQSSDCINGSQLKKVIENYKGNNKVLNGIVLKQSQILVINDEYEKILTIPYLSDVDTKKEQKTIFN